MLGRSYIVFYIFLSLVFLQSVIGVSAQNKPIEQSGSGIQPFTSLTLEIIVPKRTFLSLQPIPIIIKQSNKTNQSAMGYKGILFGLTPIRLYAKKDGSDEKVALGSQSPLAAYLVYENGEVAPGEISETKGLLTMGLHRFFPGPGVYELQAALANDDGTQLIESNTVSVEIKIPTGANLAAYNLIKNSSLQDYLFSGIKYKQAKNTLETLTALYPNSPYAKNASFLLGETYFNAKQYPQALSNLIRLENDNDFIFAEKVKNYLKEIRRSMQNQLTNDENQ